MTEERNTAAPETEESRNFILNLIDQDIAEGGQFQGQTVHTRFPPEPNGYLHIGHCKALCIDFGTAEKFGGLCNLRMDDTNPAKEDTEYVDAIQQDIHWLGFDWGDRFFYGSDYFEKDYEYAVELIKKPMIRKLILFFINVSSSIESKRRLINAATSSEGRFQFSVEKVYKVRNLIPNLAASSVMICTVSAPA